MGYYTALLRKCIRSKCGDHCSCFLLIFFVRQSRVFWQVHICHQKRAIKRWDSSKNGFVPIEQKNGNKIMLVVWEPLLYIILCFRIYCYRGNRNTSSVNIITVKLSLFMRAAWQTDIGFLVTGSRFYNMGKESWKH